MKYLVLTFLALSYSSFTFSQEEKREFEYQDGDTTYTMKKYYLLVFLSGDNKDSISDAQRSEYMKGHLANISDMGKKGFVDIAGPFGEASDKRGALLFNVESKEQINELMQHDPLVVDGRLKYEIYSWWAAKGSCLK